MVSLLVMVRRVMMGKAMQVSAGCIGRMMSEYVPKPISHLEA